MDTQIKMKKFSVIIPTKGRSKLLSQTLNALCKVQYPIDHYEIIVVDNGSKSSKTKKLVLSIGKQISNVRYVYEKEKGASFARNKGIEFSGHPYLVFIDDDILVGKNYLKALNIAWNTYPEATVLAGRVCAVLKNGEALSDYQKKMLEKYSWCFAHRTDISSDRELRWGDSFFSANMSVFLNSGKSRLFSEQLGVQLSLGNQVFGEDTEISRRMFFEKKKIVLLSSRDAEVQHQVSGIRFKNKYILNRHILCGVEQYLMDKLLVKKYKKYRSYYLTNLKTPRGFFSLLFDFNKLAMLSSYTFATFLLKRKLPLSK